MTERMLKYRYIEYVPFATREKGIPWAIIAVDTANCDGTIVVYEMENCRSWVEACDKEYLEALLSEWRKTQNKDGEPLMESLAELAIGPIRTQLSGICTIEELEALACRLNEEAKAIPPPMN